MTRLTRPALVVAGILTASLSAGTALAATPASTTLTIKAAKTTVAPKAKDTITGTLKAGSKPEAGQKVKLEKRAAGAKSFAVAGTGKTNSKGAVSFSVVPGTKKGQKEQYELVFVATKTLKGSHSAIVTVTVA